MMHGPINIRWYILSFFSLQNAVCFIILTYLVPVLFTFYVQGVLKFKKKNNSGAKRIKKISNVNAKINKPNSRFKKKVNQSRYRPGMAQRVLGC